MTGAGDEADGDSNDRWMNVGLVGAGNISRTHATAAAAEGLRITAVYAPRLEAASDLAGRYGAIGYDDLGAFLRHSPMELVAIGTPSGLHAAHGIAAAQTGRHVLVEKPLDITLEHADALIAACDSRGVRLGVFFQERTAPDLVALHDWLASGRLGRPLLVSARVRWYRPPEYYSISHWRGTRALDGGGALINQGSHTVDVLLWLFGDVRRVFAASATFMHAIETEDTLAATLEFTSGAIATFEATTAAYPGEPRRIEITTSEGTIHVEHSRVVGADLRRTELPLPWSLSAESPGEAARARSAVVSDSSGHQAVLRDFVNAIEHGRAPLCDGRAARRSLAVVEAMYASAREARPVSL